MDLAYSAINKTKKSEITFYKISYDNLANILKGLGCLNNKKQTSKGYCCSNNLTVALGYVVINKTKKAEIFLYKISYDNLANILKAFGCLNNKKQTSKGYCCSNNLTMASA
jgi:hypothetical protein